MDCRRQSAQVDDRPAEVERLLAASSGVASVSTVGHEAGARSERRTNAGEDHDLDTPQNVAAFALVCSGIRRSVYF